MSVIRNGPWLDEQVFPEPAWVVPGILPEGCCILTGHPKIGKSFLVLAIALAAADGGQILGISVEQRPVLYLALEDTDRRIQERARHLMDDEPLPAEFYYVTRENQAVSVGRAQDWLRDNEGRKPLVIVDTLEKVRGRRGANAYHDDYQAGTDLQALLAPGGAVIAVHHNRKNESSDDFLDDVSGTLGLTGSMDTIINLKRKRTEKNGTLSITGRDVDEMIYEVTFSETGRWEAGGSDLGEAARKATEGRLGKPMLQVVAAVEQLKTALANEVAIVCEIPESTARKYLSRLCERGLIARISLGTYGPVTASQVSQEDSAPDEHAEAGAAA
jgi:hypothetical protein